MRIHILLFIWHSQFNVVGVIYFAKTLDKPSEMWYNSIIESEKEMIIMGRRKSMPPKLIFIPEGSLTKVKKLAKDCANNIDGQCMPLDCDCVVDNSTDTLICNYFIKSLLPTEVELQATIMTHNNYVKELKFYNKTCKECGKKFKTVTKEQTVCDPCQKKLAKARRKKYKLPTKTK